MVDKITVGNVSVAVVLDAAPPPFEPNQFYPDVPLQAWEPYKEDHLDENGKFRTNFCTWVLRSAGQTVLVDTGLGNGRLIDNLEAVGVTPGDVSAVVITHLHGDHIGWNVTDGKATFPNARYLIPRGDWEHFTKNDIPDPLRENVAPLDEMGLMDLIDGDYAVTTEIVTLATPGHTPGHVSVLINSGGEKACVVGDLFHGSVQVTETDWNAGADMDKESARRTRHAVLDRLEQEGYTLAAGHLPIGRSIGTLARLEGRRYWQVL